MTTIKIPKKLIEVALPLDAINTAAAREKTIRHGHPSSLHLWWARRPLAAARAVIFAQMVNDPGYERYLGRGMNKEKAAIERERLFKIIEKLVQWKGEDNDAVLKEAHDEIRKSWIETCELNKNHPQASELFNPEKLPAFHDPFAGGGALPLAAQYLGLESYASDLNPVAVTINKAMLEIPPRFVGSSPVGPLPSSEKQVKLINNWFGTKGLAEDIRRYGSYIGSEAETLLENLYPKIEITSDLAEDRPDLKPLIGQKLTIIAWLWTRTVKSPNPIYSHVNVPLISNCIISRKKGNEVWVDKVIQNDHYKFVLKVGTPPIGVDNGTRTAGGRGNFLCLLSGTLIDAKYIRAEAFAGRMNTRLMAIVAEGKRGRIYLSPTLDQESIANNIQAKWKPDIEFFQQALGFRIGNYGLTKWSDLFTQRQLVALDTFSNLIQKAIEKCQLDAVSKGMADDQVGLEVGGRGATAYAQAVGVYLSFALDKMADLGNSFVGWEPIAQCPRHLFGRQAISMVWDFAEANPLSSSSGAWTVFIDGLSKAFASAFEYTKSNFKGSAIQADAANQNISSGKVISTDPPYYDNIGYADLSDFFYVWLRRNLKLIFPTLYATLSVPKAEELVATPSRHGGKENAETFFMDGMTRSMHQLAKLAHPAFPVTIYYAFKQSETNNEGGTTSTGWETFLQAVIDAGFVISGTWPMRTENSSRLRGQESNALASSIVLVCNKRTMDTPIISRRDFLRELNSVLPEALDEMTRGGINSPVAPVDLSQAIIGPGMAIFSKYSAVLEADGKNMRVKTALQLINRFLAEDDFDHDTQFCLHWFETYGWVEGKFGDADVLARAKGTSVNGLQNAGVIKSAGGNVCLLRWHEYSTDWLPENNRTPIWEALHQLIRALNQSGEFAAGTLLAKMPARAEPIRALAYRLYTLCERKGWAEEARAYNEIINAWIGIETASHEVGHSGSQAQLDI